MTPQLLWIGLGNMGRGMCRNLVEKGSLAEPLLVYNRTRKRSDDFIAQISPFAAQALDSLEESISRAGIVFTCLSDDSAVLDTYESIIRSGDVSGKTFIDCSTIHPDSAEKVGTMITGAGAEFVSSPVFGPPHMADAGTLIFVTAGPKTSIDKLRPYIKGVMGQAEISFEDKSYSTSAKFKLICNTFTLNAVTQLAEAFTLAEKSGIDPTMVKKYVDTLYGGIYTTYSGRMLGGDYWKMDEPLFSAKNALKDVNHALSLASAARVKVRNPEVGQQYLERVAEIAGGEKGDVAGVYGAVRDSNGLDYKNEC